MLDAKAVSHLSAGFLWLERRVVTQRQKARAAINFGLALAIASARSPQVCTPGGPPQTPCPALKRPISTEEDLNPEFVGRPLALLRL